MSTVRLIISSASYADEYEDSLYSKIDEVEISGINFGDIETGKESDRFPLYIRQDGEEPVYDVGYYLKPFDNYWGGYVADREDATEPYNPHWFRSGGVDEDGNPMTSTVDYTFLREVADNDPNYGVLTYYDRSDPSIKNDGLGYNNTGLNFDPIALTKVSMDYSNTEDNEEKDGYIYPAPEDEADNGKVGDEAKLDISLNIPEEIEGSGYVQFQFALRYRYTH